MKVQKLTYNWRMVGSTIDRDGAGEDWDVVEVGVKGVTKIEEIEPQNNMPLNYLASFEDGTQKRIFNPNYAVYAPE